jgi:hypothetical protein
VHLIANEELVDTLRHHERHHWHCRLALL